jgi:hypothetical protein
MMPDKALQPMNQLNRSIVPFVLKFILILNVHGHNPRESVHLRRSFVIITGWPETSGYAIQRLQCVLSRGV